MCNLAQGLIDETKDKWLQIGEEKGKEKGECNMATLVKILLKEGNVEVLERATNDEKLRQELYKKYNIL